MKHDGTVEFEVPADAIPQPIVVDREESKNGVSADESIDGVDLQYIPPMQIVMLIVGTRGDVQPFVAIAKRLQVGRYFHIAQYYSSLNSCTFTDFRTTLNLEGLVS